MSTAPFAVTWDYLCPFARNAHEHLLAGLDAGADWDVTFSPFSLLQAHVADGEETVWDRTTPVLGLLAIEVGVVVRDRYPDEFRQVHRALFAVRHDLGKDLDDRSVLGEVLGDAGLDADAVIAEVDAGWPRKEVRRAHEESVATHEIFGVPTFVLGGAAVFVRLMTRSGADGAASIPVIERVLSLMESDPDLNEFKHTTVPR